MFKNKLSQRSFRPQYEPKSEFCCKKLQNNPPNLVYKNTCIPIQPKAKHKFAMWNTIRCILHNKELSPVTHRKDNSLFLPRIDHPCSLWQCSVYFLLITLYLSSLRWYLQYRHLPGTNLNLHSNCKTNEHGSLLQCVVMNKYLGSKDKAIMKLPDGSVAKIGQEKMKIRFLIQET